MLKGKSLTQKHEGSKIEGALRGPGAMLAARRRSGHRHLFAALVLLLSALPVRAQDPFEIHVYEYEPLPPGKFTLETHLNYVEIGTQTADGTVAPTNNQFHMTFELTGGLTNNIALGMMLLTAERPGGPALEYAGWRLLPHFYAPKSWNLPLDLGFVAEFGFQNTAYEEDSRHVELRPIIGKRVGKVEIDFNPVFERALHGPGVRDGWGFEPAVRFGYEMNERFTPSLEYYATTGQFPTGSPLDRQTHQIYPGADVKLSKRLLLNLGVGVGLTGSGNRLVFKSRVEYDF